MHMNTTIFFTSLRYRLALIACLLFMSSVACEGKSATPNAELRNNEETFVFAGKCFNGEPYRLFLYQKTLSGLSRSHYDYDGPAGSGTVQSDTSPKVMATRVCRKYAEIINARYWE